MNWIVSEIDKNDERLIGDMVIFERINRVWK